MALAFLSLSDTTYKWGSHDQASLKWEWRKGQGALAKCQHIRTHNKTKQATLTHWLGWKTLPYLLFQKQNLHNAFPKYLHHHNVHISSQNTLTET